jgi:hypothetical protein
VTAATILSEDAATAEQRHNKQSEKTALNTGQFLVDKSNTGWYNVGEVRNMDGITENQTLFTVFCIEALSENLKMQRGDVYKLLTDKTNILDDYILPCYDALHTQGKEYIVNDLLELLKVKGANV